MSEQRLRVYRDGNSIRLDVIADDHDFSGVLNSTWVNPQSAIDIGEAMAAIGREILAERR